MELISVNIGREQTLRRKDRIEKTGIFKNPLSKPVQVTKLGLDNDVIVSKKHHGGPDQALYIYGLPDYEWWSKELGKEMTPGLFGENLTISELKSASFNIGDVLHVGEVVIQVTAPRIPCSTFASRMGAPQWVKKFRRAERPGLYCRVLQEGLIEAGNSVFIERYTGETLGIVEMFRDYYVKDKSMETLLRHLNAPIAIRARREIELELQKLKAD